MAFILLVLHFSAIYKLFRKNPTSHCITTYRVAYYNITQLEYYDTECIEEQIRTCHMVYRTLHRVTYREECQRKYETKYVDRYATEYQNTHTTRNAKRRTRHCMKRPAAPSTRQTAGGREAADRVMQTVTARCDP